MTRSRWYHDRWPWLLIAGPALVVIASLGSAWLAIRSDDGLVASDYYKQGLLINRKLAHMPPARIDILQATITVANDGRLRIRLQGPESSPATLHLTLARPGEPGGPQSIALVSTGGDEWLGPLVEQTSGRWIVTLESEMWRLPVTTGAGPLTEIRLANNARHS